MLFIFTSKASYPQEFYEISRDEMKDKIHGYWVGQLVGNYLGFPFENLYTGSPIPVYIDRYLDYRSLDSLDVKMNINDRRGYTPVMANALDGGWTDDDTDIEFVTLHALELYGLDLNYEEIAVMWKKHINRFIWSANRKARDLMDEGLVPPATGSKDNNPYWYRITSQLVNEIWGVIYPGMLAKASERSEWGARIMCDDWATHATIAYGVMYSAAFFEKDVNKLVDIAIDHLPENSPYREGMINVVRWYSENENWQDTRKLIHDQYYNSVDGFEVPYKVGGAVVNGLNGILAILYGQGDFTKTVAIATTAGYDCDNQAATCGGLMGIIHGGSAIPEYLTTGLPLGHSWDTPFNDTYINYSRDELPAYNRISHIVERILVIMQQAILEEGGTMVERNGKVYYRILLN